MDFRGVQSKDRDPGVFQGGFTAVATELCFVSMRHEGWGGAMVNILEEGSRAAGELDGSAQWFVIQQGHL